MKRLILFTGIIILLSGCGAKGSSSDAGAATDPKTPALQPIGNLSPPGSPAPISLTYYTLVVNETLDSYSITVTGHCVVYTAVTYCWDDGWQKTPVAGVETDFWGLCSHGGVIGECSGGAWVDPVTTPTIWDSYFTVGNANIPTPLHQPSDVFAGVPTTVSCTLSGSTLDCLDFSIDTAQVPL